MINWVDFLCSSFVNCLIPLIGLRVIAEICRTFIFMKD